MKFLKSGTPTRTVALVAFVVFLALVGIFSFSTVRDLVVSWQVTGLEGGGDFEPAPGGPAAPVATLDPTVPLQPLTGPTPEPWDGASRVTILLMGLDYRDWAEGQGPPRTDTMLLFTIDPVTNSAGMLSIPRDLWVPIPGFDNGKINTAYQLGEVYELPGGGPGLAVETVEQFLGVPINFYAQVDFSAFEKMIDEIGGVKLNVPEKIKVDPLGPDNTKTLKPGVQTLPGAVALAYARARNTEGGDFDRAQRQQQVILAIRERVLSFDLLPVLIAKSPILYHDVSTGVNTNMTLEQAIKLALLIQNIPADNIERGAIGMEQITFGTSPEGLDILKPLPDQIRLLRDEIFTHVDTVSPAAQAQTTAQLIAAEKAQIAVLNGTSIPGLAAETTEYLREKGITVAVTENASEFYEQTTIVDFTGNPYTLQYLIDELNISPNRIFHSYNPDSEIDIEINLGTDWANSGNLP